MERTGGLEISSKTVDEAVNEALMKLKLRRDEVKVTILDVGAKGFLGIGSKLARVYVEPDYDPAGKAKQFLREIAIAMGVSADVSCELDEKALNINISGEDMGVFIGKRGQTLDSLQYIVNLVVNRGKGAYVNVMLDSENYRKRRQETLESLSASIARKVRSTQRAVVLEPMPSNERRIIHTALQNDKYVTTYSQGEEPFRNVVIAPKKGEGRAPKSYSGDRDRKYSGNRLTKTDG